MNKKVVITLALLFVSALIYVGCKKSSNDSSTPIVAGTCSDGIQNQNETGVDCGGSCTACPTCTDGIQNGTETGVDCGGNCTACIPPSLTATVSTLGSFSGDTSTCYVDTSVATGFTSYRVVGFNGGSGTSSFDLLVKFNNSIASFAVNVDYVPGNISGVLTTLILRQYIGSVLHTFGSINATGKIRFTSINYVTRKVSGTFEFTGSDGATNSVITNGLFTNLELQ